MLKRKLKQDLQAATQDHSEEAFEQSSSDSESDSFDSSDESTTPNAQKQRLLIVPSRGIGFRYRHFMLDLAALLPHSRKENKLDTKNQLTLINELCGLESCTQALFLEGRKGTDLYMWLADVAGGGASAKFHVENLHTAGELNMEGNCMRRSRPILSFDEAFEGTAELKTCKFLLTACFGSPERGSKTNPYYDHIFSFSFADDRIWFRNYQVIEEPSKGLSAEMSLKEIGPRFCMQLIKLHQKPFSGPIIYNNPLFVSPNALRAAEKKEEALKYARRVTDQENRQRQAKELQLEPSIFETMYQ
jgi:ribosome biogenesis protein BRX1